MSEIDPTLGEEIVAWIESVCRVPEGALIGQPIELMDWQRDAIRKTYDNPHGTRRCIISVGRKSATAAGACNARFWLPSEGLSDKSRSDRVPYDSWAAKGFLQTTPGSSVSYEYVARHLKQERKAVARFFRIVIGIVTSSGSMLRPVTH